VKYFDNPEWVFQKYIKESLSMAQIAKMIGMNFGAVRDRLIKFKIPIRNRKEAQSARAIRNKKIFHDRNWLLVQYWELNRNTEEIAKQFDVSRQTIYFWLKRHKIRIKTNSESRMGRPASVTAKEHMRKAQTGRHHPESVKQKIGDAQRGAKNHMWGKKLSVDHIAKLREASLRNWANDGYVKNVLCQTRKRPTSPERIVSLWFPELRYTGNGIWWRKLANGKNKNPDFKITGQNKVIEIFGDYWHRGENPRKLIDLYKQAGIDCLVIWEKEINRQPEITTGKISQFISQ